MNELFKNIKEVSKIRILQELESVTRTYKKNTTIMSSIKKDNIICILIKGHIQIIKNDFNGNYSVIEDINNNNIFGSISANISSNDYEIITKEDSEIIIIELDNIFSYNKNIDEYNIFIKNLLNIFYQKIIEFNNHIEILSNKSIRDKLLAYFKLISIRNNISSKIIYLPFNYNDLATYLAINRSAMSREMKLMKDDGLIEVKGKKIKLLYYI